MKLNKYIVLDEFKVIEMDQNSEEEKYLQTRKYCILTVWVIMYHNLEAFQPILCLQWQHTEPSK